MAQRRNQEEHDTLVDALCTALALQECQHIRVDLEEGPYRHPEKTPSGHVPDVTAYRNHVLHIYEVETADTIAHPDTAGAWRDSAMQAADNGSLFTVDVPPGHQQEAEEELRRLGLGPACESLANHPSSVNTTWLRSLPASTRFSSFSLILPMGLGNGLDFGLVPL